jgi:hypothetical protein
MNESIFITELPFPIELKGNETKKFTFGAIPNNIEIKFVKDIHLINIILKGIAGEIDTKSISTNNFILDRTQRTIILIKNTIDKPISIILDNLI